MTDVGELRCGNEPRKIPIKIHRVIPEKELATNLEKGWLVVTQLKNGNVVIENQILGASAKTM